MLNKLVLSLIGTRTTWRLGRAFYMAARGDVANNMGTNGERMVQRCVVEAWRKRHDPAERLVVFDVGANVGDWSTALLDQAAESNAKSALDLFLFEPIPDTLRVLRVKLSGESVANVRMESIALSALDGSSEMYSPGPNAGTSSLHYDSSFGEVQAISVQTASLSSYCASNSIERIRLLKCDTEGHDMGVIRGALPMLQGGRIDVLQFEYNHRWIFARSYLKDVFDTVVGLPYVVGKIQPDHVKVLDRWHPELEHFFEGNYLLIHQRAVPWFDARKATFDPYNTLTTERS